MKKASKEIMVAFKTTTPEEADYTMMAEAIMGNATELDGIRFVSIPLVLFEIDYNYQRPVDNVHVEELRPFKRHYAGALIASYRNGRFYIIDGQNRYHAAVLDGKVKTLNCLVYTGLTAKEEAKIFKDLNTKQKKPNPYSIFKSNIFSEDVSDPDVVVDMKIFEICNAHDIEVKKFSRGSTGKALRCLSRARQIVQSQSYDGIACFKWIIDFINTTKWANVSTSYTREIILMLKDFWINNHGNHEIEERLREVINGKPEVPMYEYTKNPETGITPEAMINGAVHFYRDYGQAEMYLYLQDLINGTIK